MNVNYEGFLQYPNIAIFTISSISWMKLFYKIVSSGVEIHISTYSILLKNLLAAGNWRKYIEVRCSNVCAYIIKESYLNFVSWGTAIIKIVQAARILVFHLN